VHASVESDGSVSDEIDEYTGLRSYNLTADDFVLNGASRRLRGASKMQETEKSAVALSDEELIADWEQLGNLGVNYVRLCCFPRAELEYAQGDVRGIMLWAETGHTNSGPTTPNGENIARELVHQNYNHPAIIFWSAGNEAPAVDVSAKLAGVLHEADPSRPIVYAANGQNPENVDYLFHNTYEGWYGGSMYDFLANDWAHWISETGGGMSISTHSSDYFGMSYGVASYEPEEYGALLNEIRFDDLFRNPSHVPAFSNWVFREFSDGRYKGMVNSKGIETLAGFPKDVFYHYQSFLKSDAVLHIVGAHYFLRSADPNGNAPIKVYSNAASLTLTVNDVEIGSLGNEQYMHPNGTPIKNVFYWPDALELGKNVIAVSDGKHSESATVYYKADGSTLPADSNAKVQNLTSSNGAAYFIDAPIHAQWPFYYDFDGNGDNTFDVLPSELEGASWITTRRQSDAALTTNLSFDLPSGGDVYVMVTDSGSDPAWITDADMSNTGTSGKWRDNGLKLVDYRLYKKTLSAGANVSFTPSAVDYVVMVK
jgi:beta-galactosidase